MPPLQSRLQVSLLVVLISQTVLLQRPHDAPPPPPPGSPCADPIHSAPLPIPIAARRKARRIFIGYLQIGVYHRRPESTRRRLYDQLTLMLSRGIIAA